MLDFLVSFVVIAVMFALMFKFVPAAKVQWTDVWVGAVSSTFGAASSLVVIMLWAFYSSQIVLFGAEFTRLYAMRFGSKILPSADADRIVTRRVETREPSWHKK